MWLVIGAKLYEFRLTGSKPQYVVSTLPPDEVRKYSHIWDEGDDDYQVFQDTFKKGECKQITNVEQVADECRTWCPFSTDEEITKGHYFDFDDDIEHFFKHGVSLDD